MPSAQSGSPGAQRRGRAPGGRGEAKADRSGGAPRSAHDAHERICAAGSLCGTPKSPSTAQGLFSRSAVQPGRRSDLCGCRRTKRLQQGQQGTLRRCGAARPAARDTFVAALRTAPVEGLVEKRHCECLLLEEMPRNGRCWWLPSQNTRRLAAAEASEVQAGPTAAMHCAQLRLMQMLQPHPPEDAYGSAACSRLHNSATAHRHQIKTPGSGGGSGRRCKRGRASSPLLGPLATTHPRMEKSRGRIQSDCELYKRCLTALAWQPDLSPRLLASPRLGAPRRTA